MATAAALSLALHAAIISSVPIKKDAGFMHRGAHLTAPLLRARIEPTPPLQPAPPAAHAPALVLLTLRNDATKVAQAANFTDLTAPSVSEDPLPPRDLPPESGYYPEKDVDVRAAPIGDIEPADPDLSGTVSGTIVLRLEINAQGIVDRVIVVRAVPDYAFGQDAFAAFKNARFAPARKTGMPVPSEIRVELRYGASRAGSVSAPRP
jgi:protein TonB